MKLLVAICLIFSVNTLYATSLTWPGEHYTIESINSQFFGRLKSYMGIIQGNNPIKQTYNGFRIYHKQHNYVKVRASYKLDGEYTYLNYKSWNKNLVIRVLNNDELLARELLSFNFDEILKKNNFMIEINKFGLLFKKERLSASEEYMNYIMDWGELHLQESTELNFLKSKLYVECEQCSGEPLILLVKNKNGLIEKEHFIGPLQVPTSPNRFYQIANTWYLPGIIGQASSVIERLQNHYGWPSER